MAMIKYYAPMRSIVGMETETVAAASIAEVLTHIKTAHGKEAYKAAKSALIVVNDVSIGLYRGKKTALKKQDTVGFLPLCGGG
ncbi:MAG: MoaD/ThiS family protein [Clostridia bacterium]